MKSKEQGQLLSRKDIDKTARSYIFFSQAAQNFEHMIGLASCHVTEPTLEKLYKGDDEEHKRALKRHMQFYNTESQLGALTPDITAVMEETRASGEGISEELIVNTKNTLMGPFAGIGDFILIGTLGPILLSIAMSMCINDGNPMGPTFFCVTWLVPMVALQWFLSHRDYSMGTNAASTFFGNKTLINKITTGLTMMGLIVIGGMVSTTAKAGVIHKFVSDDMSISTQEQIFDKIMPAPLPLTVTLVMWYLMDKKKRSANEIILAIAAFAAAVVALGIM